MSRVNQKTKICVMCGDEKVEGIIIQSGFICDKCEYEIIHTEVGDEKYPFFIQRMKKLWLKNA
ncbi:inhibitor of sigma-G Gin [Vulcanibacillus modesticaldus]|uniref:Inhibitor of sigma-G Gin n=1 Tax=Vulcanibacillus modesticaldus TaxID=337097 RepID=A0A1D2YVA1_9BACI|nr:sigma factor G inhibitor Gin [Vulcanibacillus modesticaldus]OEF99650.1 inhibitor of sigma-G Gin [Vulcanibacillus modesticaldus]